LIFLTLDRFFRQILFAFLRQQPPRYTFALKRDEVR
jgi:hypothetical protein